MIQAGQFLEALQTRFADRWHLTTDAHDLVMRSKRPSGPPSRAGSLEDPAALAHTFHEYFARAGLPRARPLPIRWNRDTDLTISAIQGLDPWLKDAQPHTWREGYLPQPVVRFTGDRAPDGRLREGFLSSFVNISLVQRVASLTEHAALLDTCIGALSSAGIHASRLRIHGPLTIWTRDSVSGITLHIDADMTNIGDAVLLWNAKSQQHMATDLGFGLERLTWIHNGGNWAYSCFGSESAHWDVPLLDAVRTATLMTMGGIHPHSRGPGNALRRVIHQIPAHMAASGLGRLIRPQRAYWAQFGISGPQWPHLSEIIEDELLRPPADLAPHRRASAR